MQHHSFAAEVSTRFANYLGHTVSLRKEDDNEWDKGRAVAAYMDFELLAYVTGDEDKACVRSMLKLSGRKQLYGTIERFVPARSKHMSNILKLRIEVPDGMLWLPEAAAGTTNWDEWCFSGPVLPLGKDTHHLHAVADEVLDMLEQGVGLTDYIRAGLNKIAELSWTDISKEMSETYRQMLRILTKAAESDSSVGEAADMMQQLITHVGSEDVRQKLYTWMCNMARSEAVSTIISQNGYTLQTLTPLIPSSLVNMMATTKQDVIGRLWYLGIPGNVLHGLMSSLIYLLRLLMDADSNMATVHLPLAERQIKVKRLLESCKGMPPEFCREVCNIIARNVTGMDEADLKVLDNASKGVLQPGIQINNSVLAGNNLVDNLSSTNGTMPTPPQSLPIVELTKLLPEND